VKICFWLEKLTIGKRPGKLGNEVNSLKTRRENDAISNLDQSQIIIVTIGRWGKC